MRTTARWSRWIGLLLAVAAGLALPAAAAAGTPAHPTADVLAAPSPVLRTDDRRHLVYEIVMRNPTTARAVLERLVVVDQDRTAVAAFGPETIATLLGPSGVPLVPEPELGPGQALTLFLDVALPRGRQAPAELAHRFELSVAPEAGAPRRVTFTGAHTTVERGSPLRVSPPLGGDGLLGIIAHGPVTIEDRLSHAQRYAIDFGRLNAAGDGLFDGDPRRNESYAVHGSEVLAVAPGRIVAVRDDMPENTPPAEPAFTTFDDVAGNRVVQDLGGGRYALYAHLQPGSIPVRTGQRVQRGQTLGLVGNTGLSSGPHLHFQIMDGPGGPSALDANGLPYVFDRFALAGNVGDLSAPVLTPAAPPRTRTDQLLVSGDVIAVP